MCKNIDVEGIQAITTTFHNLKTHHPCCVLTLSSLRLKMIGLITQHGPLPVEKII